MEATISPLLNPWEPMKDRTDLKILGKALEEAGEYTQALSRCLIQGIDESEPVTGKPNRKMLEEELADIMATSRHVMQRFKLDAKFIESRYEKKYEQLKGWFYEM